MAAVRPLVVRWKDRIRAWLGLPEGPENLLRGRLGEQAARHHLERSGLKFLTSNFRTPRGEIDLVFRDAECLVFVEVKARSRGAWTRPAAAVNAAKRRRISRAALAYVRRLDEPRVKIRFDVVEVLLEDGRVAEVRHLPRTFALTPPYRYG